MEYIDIIHRMLCKQAMKEKKRNKIENCHSAMEIVSKNSIGTISRAKSDG